VKRAVPARLHVLLARDASAAVVIRREPSRHTAVIGWDRKTDKFTLGQWLNGRIYERRADLSPDGKHLIYFAMNGRWNSRAKGAWTAISRAPYLKAVSLFAKGDCWHGGGRFTSPREYWLNDGYGHQTLDEDRHLQRLPKHDWEWAEQDGRRLVWAEGGALHAGRMGPKGLHGEAVLARFDEMRFERLAAPY
jgi:hypothetical protein